MMDKLLGFRGVRSLDADQAVEIIHNALNADKFVSLDFFDTLVVRPLARPRDIFAILGMSSGKQEIIARRSRMERELINRFHKQPALIEIYRAVCDTEELAQELAAAEIAMERRLLRPTRFALLLADQLIQSPNFGIVSDTPHSSQTVRLLSESIIGCAPTLILTSADEGKSKASGDLFPVLENRVGMPAHQILHVGDNRHSDVRQARSHGLSAIHITSELDNYTSHRSHRKIYGNVVHTGHSADSMSIGLIKNKWHNTPSLYCYNGNLRCFGYTAYGPIVLALAHWLIGVAKSRELNKVYCLSRDGFLISECINGLSAHFNLGVSAVYIPASRRMSRLITIKDRCELKALLCRMGGNKEENLANILPELPTVPSRGDTSDLYIDIVFEKITLQKYLYRQELESIFQSEDILLYDIGYRGTTQAAINGLVKNNIYGAYALTHNALKINVPDWEESTRSYLNQCGSMKNQDGFDNYRRLHEAIMSAPHGSFLGYRDETNERAFEDIETPKGLRTLFEGIDEFWREFLTTWPLEFDDIDMSADFAFAHAHAHFARPIDLVDVTMFQEFVFTDIFDKNSVRPFISERNQSQVPIWREGVSALTRRSLLLAHLSNVKLACSKRLAILIVPFLRSPAKRRKLQRDPFLFFSDASHPLVRGLRWLF